MTTQIEVRGNKKFYDVNGNNSVNRGDPDCKIINKGTRQYAKHSHLNVGIEELIRNPDFIYPGRTKKNDTAPISLDHYGHFTDEACMFT